MFLSTRGTHIFVYLINCDKKHVVEWVLTSHSKGWFTLATESEAESESETQGASQSSVNKKSESKAESEA